MIQKTLNGQSQITTDKAELEVLMGRAAPHYRTTMLGGNSN